MGLRVTGASRTRPVTLPPERLVHVVTVMDERLEAVHGRTSVVERIVRTEPASVARGALDELRVFVLPRVAPALGAMHPRVLAHNVELLVLPGGVDDAGAHEKPDVELPVVRHQQPVGGEEVPELPTALRYGRGALDHRRRYVVHGLRLGPASRARGADERAEERVAVAVYHGDG